MGLAQIDNALSPSVALPASATSAYTAGIDVGRKSSRDQIPPCELKIVAPALAVGQLANGSTMKYTVQHDDDSAFGTVATLLPDVITQTGAGGVGAAATSITLGLTADAKRYVRLKITNSAAADASGATAQLQTRF